MTEPTVSIDEQAEAFKAWLRGDWKLIQFREGRSWVDFNDGRELFLCRDRGDVIRLKPVPKPPTYLPWTAEEVPVGAQVRDKCHPPRFLIGAVSTDPQVDLVGWGWVKCDELLRQFEHSTDNGKTWAPCGVKCQD